MALFNLKAIPKVDTKSVASKLKASKVSSKTGDTLYDTINIIKQKVAQELGIYGDKYIRINTLDQLEDYVQYCAKNGIYGIDTETSSLDPISCNLVGISLKTPGLDACYIPLNHISYVTGQRSQNQLELSEVSQCLKPLLGVSSVMHNAKFDINVMKCQLGLDFSKSLVWDTMVCAKLLDHREKAGLKYQHSIKIQKVKKVNDYSELFDKVNFADIPISTGYLYAARDAEMTLELYEYQKNIIESQGYEKLNELYTQIELPLVSVVADMQLRGVGINIELCEQLSKKFHKVRSNAIDEIQRICEIYKEDIVKYQRKNPTSKFKMPLNQSSNDQVAMFLFDVLGLETPKKNSRSVDVEALTMLDHPVSKALLEFRKVEKLLTTYVDKLPNTAHPQTGCVHASFNQNGTDTGRMSSSDPNMQNIPSRGDGAEIRQAFYPKSNKEFGEYYFVQSDYSQQEPMVTAWLSQDKNMLQAFRSGQDIYAVVASGSFNVPYDCCLEFRPDGSKSPEGKERRSSAKIIQLAMTYGQTAYSLSKSLGKPTKECEKIQSNFFKMFPRISEFTEETFQFAFENGYVETLWGRRRYLPHMQLEPYDMSWISGVSNDFDVLDFENDSTCEGIPDHIYDEYAQQLEEAYGWKTKQKIMEEAKKNNIQIVDNTLKIGDAERQSINTPIQGTSADMVKLAMVKLFQNEEFRSLGCYIALQVHDELICAVPKKNIKRGAEIIQEIMVNAPQVKIKLPLKVDMVVTKEWDGEKVEF